MQFRIILVCALLLLIAVVSVDSLSVRPVGEDTTTVSTPVEEPMPEDGRRRPDPSPMRPHGKKDRRRPGPPGPRPHPHPHPHPHPPHPEDGHDHPHPPPPPPHPHPPHPHPEDSHDHPHPPPPPPHPHPPHPHLDSAILNKPILTQQFVDEVNRLAKGEWTASAENGRTTRHLTHGEAMTLMGTRSLDNSAVPARVFTEAELAADIPESFDSAKQWPQCKSISEIRDQSSCGSCWAIAAAEAITDRYCTVAGVDRRISTANLLSCCVVCGFGCQGGWPTMAWMWWSYVGLTTEECQPYPFAPCGHHSDSSKYPACPSGIYDTPSCNTTCADGAQAVKYKGAQTYAVSGEEAYQRELMANGPFEVAFTVYADFVAYKSGVYSHVAGDQLGGHAVKLVGWGTLNGVPYWKVANSWNEEWGDDGYFLIRRGSDECGVESSGVAGVPENQ